jgi:hypothetical protein
MSSKSVEQKKDEDCGGKTWYNGIYDGGVNE